ISTLAGQGQQKPVIDKLGRLSEVLRAALSGERPDEIPLKQELALLDGYLQMSDSGVTRGDAHINVAPDTVSALVPRTILPTIAEHLVPHAKDGSHDGHRVSVRAARHDETLHLEMTIAAHEQSAIGEWQDHE